MPVLTVIREGKEQAIPFEGTPIVGEVLSAHGLHTVHPCGGHGTCMKCAVKMSGMLSPATKAEEKLPEGMRLSCQTRLLGDAQIEMMTANMENIQLAGMLPQFDVQPVEGTVGAAVDVGTTTLAVRLIDLKTGRVLGECARENPQRSIAADVIGRMEAAMAGKGGQLMQSVSQAVQDMVSLLCARMGLSHADQMIVTGNTTMLYLFTGRNPEALSHAPFEADCLFDLEEAQGKTQVYYPGCMSAFVGADITCAVLASQMMQKDETALLIDVGTNGEIALWHEEKLTVSATAAGPAFEGGGIEMGCGSIPGAVDKVWVENDALKCTTIGGEKAVGVCGSGLIDAVAAMLDLEWIDETGAVDEDELTITQGVHLTPGDVRSVQLAKGAIAAGIQTLLEDRHITPEKIDTMYLAGGFGSHLNLKSAARIGLIPEELVEKTKVMGNAALAGAQMLLLRRAFREEASQIVQQSETVNLGGNPQFTNHFMECMMFE